MGKMIGKTLLKTLGVRWWKSGNDGGDGNLCVSLSRSCRNSIESHLVHPTDCMPLAFLSSLRGTQWENGKIKRTVSRFSYLSQPHRQQQDAPNYKTSTAEISFTHLCQRYL